MQVCRAAGCGVHFEVGGAGQRGGKQVERHHPAPAPAKNAWDNYVGQLLLLLRYTRHTAIADPCAGA
jgi:hypothetical protein